MHRYRFLEMKTASFSEYPCKPVNINTLLGYNKILA